VGIRLADLTGNGRTDYLCIQKDGTTKAWVQNDQGGWEDIGQIKFSEQKDRANLRWHDVNGDGKADSKSFLLVANSHLSSQEHRKNTGTDDSSQ